MTPAQALALAHARFPKWRKAHNIAVSGFLQKSVLLAVAALEGQDVRTADLARLACCCQHPAYRALQALEEGGFIQDLTACFRGRRWTRYRVVWERVAETIPGPRVAAAAGLGPAAVAPQTAAHLAEVRAGLPPLETVPGLELASVVYAACKVLLVQPGDLRGGRFPRAVLAREIAVRVARHCANVTLQAAGEAVGMSSESSIAAGQVRLARRIVRGDVIPVRGVERVAVADAVAMVLQVARAHAGLPESSAAA